MIQLETPVIKEAVKELLPPGMPKALRWRLSIFAVCLLFLFHILYACGWLARFGFGEGFATAADFKSLSQEVKDIKVDLLEQRIYEAQKLRCESQKSQNYVALQFYINQVNKMHREYAIAMKGVLLQVPTCQELGIDV